MSASTAISVRMLGMNEDATTDQLAHDFRLSRQLAHVDSGRSHLNRVLLVPPAQLELRQRTIERRDRMRPQRALRSNAAIATRGIITFGKAAQAMIEAAEPAAQDAAYLAVARAIGEHYRVELLGLVVHADETAPHAHVIWDRRTETGERLNIKGQTVQDLAARAIAGHFPGITRGVAKTTRKAAGEPKSAWLNRSVKQLHQNLPAELAALEDEIATLRNDLGELEVRRNRAQHFKNALDEIEAGRMRPLEAKRQWKVEARTEATAGIEKCGFTIPEWAELRGWQAAHDRLREVKQALAELKKTRQAAEREASDAEEEASRRRTEIDGEIQAMLEKAEILEVARQEIAAGRLTPGETPGGWVQAGQYDRARWDAVAGKITGPAAREIWPKIRQLALIETREAQLKNVTRETAAEIVNRPRSLADRIPGQDIEAVRRAEAAAIEGVVENTERATVAAGAILERLVKPHPTDRGVWEPAELYHERRWQKEIGPVIDGRFDGRIKWSDGLWSALKDLRKQLVGMIAGLNKEHTLQGHQLSDANARIKTLTDERAAAQKVADRVPQLEEELADSEARNSKALDIARRGGLQNIIAALTPVGLFGRPQPAPHPSERDHSGPGMGM